MKYLFQIYEFKLLGKLRNRTGPQPQQRKTIFSGIRQPKHVYSKHTGDQSITSPTGFQSCFNKANSMTQDLQYKIIVNVCDVVIKCMTKCTFPDNVSEHI
jgi:hypothetical protein